MDKQKTLTEKRVREIVREEISRLAIDKYNMIAKIDEMVAKQTQNNKKN